MSISANFDALFTASFQQEGLPDLLPLDRAQEMVSRLDRTLEKLEAAAASKLVAERDEELHGRFERMLRLYRAAEEFVSSDSLAELHTESERQAVLRLIDDLHKTRALIADAAEAKVQEVNEAAKAITAAILEQIERDRVAAEAGAIREQHTYEVQEGVTNEDFETMEGFAPLSGLEDRQREVPAGDHLTFDEHIDDSNVLDEDINDDDFADEDYDQYGEEGEEGNPDA